MDNVLTGTTFHYIYCSENIVKKYFYHVPHWAPLNRTLELVRPLDRLRSFGTLWIRISEGYIVQLQPR